MADRHASRKDLARLGRRLDRRIRKIDGNSRARDNKLEAKIDRVALSLVKTQADVADIKENMVTKDDFRRLFTVVEGFGNEVRLYRQESATIRPVLDSHGHRLTALESRQK